MNNNLAALLEAILFFKASPLSVDELARATKRTPQDVEAALTELEGTLQNRGIALLRAFGKVELTTAPFASSIIETFAKEELSRDLGKAGLETLTIVLYRHPVTRSEIDFIRGVNSTYILRALVLRGLIERVSNPKDERSYQYQPTLTFLKHLGLTKVSDLPEYEKVRDAFDAFFNREKAEAPEEV